MRTDIIEYLQKEVYHRCKQPTNKFGMGCYYHIEAVVKKCRDNMRLRRFKIMDISKKDWKLFRERLSGWQENYMEGLVKEYANFLNDDKKPASEKFWELEKRIKEDKRHPGVIMEMSKSEVIWDIVRLIRLKVITYDDLSDFSDELQLEVKRILEMSR